MVFSGSLVYWHCVFLPPVQLKFISSDLSEVNWLWFIISKKLFRTVTEWALRTYFLLICCLTTFFHDCPHTMCVCAHGCDHRVCGSVLFCWTACGWRSVLCVLLFHVPAVFCRIKSKRFCNSSSKEMSSWFFLTLELVFIWFKFVIHLEKDICWISVTNSRITPLRTWINKSTLIDIL